jgi:Fe-S-cluster containining protein
VKGEGKEKLIISEPARAESLEELYSLTGEVLNKVRNTNPGMLCKAGCNQCCKTYGSPLVTPLEWEKIRDFLDKADQDLKERIKTDLDKVKAGFKKVKNDKNRNLKNVINNIQCPFLQNELCSVYEVRPLVCRMFGSFISRPGLPKVSGNSVFACEMEKDRWDAEISEKGLNSINLPDKAPFYDQLISLNGKEVKALFLISYIDLYFNPPPDPISLPIGPTKERPDREE